MHQVMNALMYRMNDNRLSLSEVAHGMLGNRYHDRELTEVHLDTMILPRLTRSTSSSEAMAMVAMMCWRSRSGSSFPAFPAPSAPRDLILDSATHVLHVDWKFGRASVSRRSTRA
jgi:hypothetical protein